MCLRLGHTGRTKHIEIRHLYVQSMVKEKKLEVVKESTLTNKADVGTKHFDAARLAYLRRRLGRAHRIDELFDQEGLEINSIEMQEEPRSCSLTARMAIGAGIGMGILLSYTVVKLRSKCSKRLSSASRAEASGTPEPKEIDKEVEIEKLLKLTQLELKELCKVRGLAISGNKTQMASRLVQSSPIGPKPSRTQVKQLHDLVQSRCVTVGSEAYVSEKECKRAIDALSRMKKA